MGLGGLEPPTSPLSGVRSNQAELQTLLLVKQIKKTLCQPHFHSLDFRPNYSIFKEVIQPQVPLRLPCYDFTPVMNHTVASAPLSVKQPASGATHFHGVTGGVYKARERIHRDMLIRDY